MKRRFPAGLSGVAWSAGLAWLLLAGCNGKFYFDQHSIQSGGEPSGGHTSGGDTGGASEFGGSGGHGGSGGSGGSGGEPASTCAERCAAAGLLCQASNLRCVECTGDTDCRKKGLARCSFEGRCVACFEDHDCSLFDSDDDELMCEPATHSCVRACYAEEKSCHEYECENERRPCVTCASDSECVGSTAGPHCIGDHTRCG
ncbi:MAG TPA: hypothetical protein VFQ61_32190, partial [Polyangiaceae bacterium]|nr:hypothetical protein [Polyangiaceae bacterium]